MVCRSLKAALAGRPVLFLLWLAVGGCGAGEDRPAGVRSVVRPTIGPTDQGGERIDRQAPALDGVRWLDEGDGEAWAPGARGKITLIRWFTDTCPFCVNSAPALRALAERHPQDLEVRAIFHAKPRGRQVGDSEVRKVAQRLGLPFALGIDPDWSGLDRWWLAEGDKDYTSVTFLLDQDGVVRLVHNGGEFHTVDQVEADRCERTPAECGADYEALDQAISTLIERPA